MNGRRDTQRKKKHVPPSTPSDFPGAPENQPELKRPEKGSAERKKRDYSEARILGFPILDFLQGTFNFLLVLTAIVGAFVILRQLDIMEEQLADARSAVHLEQRAWLGIEKIEGEPQIGSQWNIAVVLRNSGNTPAVGVEASMFVDPQPGVQLRPTTAEGGYSGDIQPGATVTLRFVAPVMDTATGSLKSVDAAAVRLLETGAVKIYLRGNVTYADVFRRRHTLLVCHVYSPDVRVFSICRSSEQK
jgi:hypothetical protein